MTLSRWLVLAVAAVAAWALARGPRELDRALLPSGDRAVSVALDDGQIRALRPGDRVDLIAVFDARQGAVQDRLAATILQNVEVVGVSLASNGKSKGVLRLSVNPTEAEYAALAASQSELSVALRAPGDAEMHPMEMASLRRLFK